MWTQSNPLSPLRYSWQAETIVGRGELVPRLHLLLLLGLLVLYLDMSLRHHRYGLVNFNLFPLMLRHLYLVLNVYYVECWKQTALFPGSFRSCGRHRVRHVHEWSVFGVLYIHCSTRTHTTAPFKTAVALDWVHSIELLYCYRTLRIVKGYTLVGFELTFQFGLLKLLISSLALLLDCWDKGHGSWLPRIVSKLINGVCSCVD